jgi:ribonuclease P protein subunit RPR2
MEKNGKKKAGEKKIPKKEKLETPEEKTYKKEKKLSGKQKLALERIYRLFELAEEMHEKEKEEYTKRYLGIAKKISEKMKVKIPKEMKKRFCKKCLTMKIKTREEKPFIIVKCEECGKEKKYPLEEK